MVNERKRTSFHSTACTAETEQAGATLVSDSKAGVPGVPGVPCVPGIPFVPGVAGVPGVPGVAGGPGASEAVVRLIRAKWQD